MVSDDFKGLREAIHEVFPQSDHQLCYAHLMRNIPRNLRREDISSFIAALKRIYVSPSYEIGLGEFRDLCEEYKGRYPHYMELLIKKAENYLVFLKYPEAIRGYLYNLLLDF